MGGPIGIFDSGLGGLTVVRAFRRRLPHESIVYFGDTARVPYGTKSSPTVVRFAAEDCAFLARFEPKVIVAACNTASAAALEALRARFALPICGVIEPGAAEAVRACRGRPIGVIATEATVSSGAYRRAIERRLPGATLIEKACPLLVPLVEERRGPADPIVRAVLAEYLDPLRRAGVGTLVLGCTHYPLLKAAVAEFMGPEVALIDSAEAVAAETAALLESERRLDPRGEGRVRFFVSDNPERFRAVGRRFLGEPVAEVSLVAPEAFFSEPAAAPAPEAAP